MGAAVDAAALAAAVAQHVEERGLLLNPAAAHDRCQSESAAFMETLAGWEVEATVVSGFKRDESGVVMVGHFAVRVGDDVWDWTARQFDPTCPVPLITPWKVWERQWWNPTAGWFDPLADPLTVLFDLAERLDGNDGETV